MTTKPDIGSYSLIKVSDKQKLKEISEKIQHLVKKNKDLKTDLKISNPETKDFIILLITLPQKKMKKFLFMPINTSKKVWI